LSSYCNLPQEAYWEGASVLLYFAHGDARLPDDIHAECEECGHVGWRWRARAASVCQSCRALRLRAARLADRLLEAEAENRPHQIAPKGTSDIDATTMSPWIGLLPPSWFREHA